MATKAQIARRKYGMGLQDLSAGQKAAVSRAYNAQSGATSAPTITRASGNVKVSFKRPGIVTKKSVSVTPGTSVEQALVAAGITLVKSKEGIIDEAGNTVLLSRNAQDGATYIIAPGVKSSF